MTADVNILMYQTCFKTCRISDATPAFVEGLTLESAVRIEFLMTN